MSAIVAWASRRRIAVLIGIGCLMLASPEGARRLSFDADILALLPQNGRVIPAFREFLARFGTLDQLYVVFTAPDGHAIDDYRDEIDAWVEQLKAAPEIAAVDAESSIDRATSAGWPIASCCCSTATHSTKRSAVSNRGTDAGGRGAAASC